MASFTAPTDFNYDQLVASETVSRGGTMTSGAGVVKRGTIVGLSGTTGKYTKTDPATGILAQDCDATAADVGCVVYVQGKFAISGIIWPAAGSHASHTALLHDLGIYILSVELESGLLMKPDTSAVGLAVMPAVREIPGWDQHLQTDPAQPTVDKFTRAAEIAAQETQPGRRRPVHPDVALGGYQPVDPSEPGEPGTPPAVTVLPTSIDQGPGVGGGSISVTSASEDPWTATASDSWIIINSPTDPVVGDDSVSYGIEANETGSARTGSITIGDQTVAVSQGA